jgi:Transposase DDE domain
MPIEDFITHVYVIVDDYFKKVTSNKVLRRRGEKPSLSDSEVIAMEIIGEYMGFSSDKRIWQYFKQHWLSCFPKLGCRSSFVRQGANLYGVKLDIQRLLSAELSTDQDLFLFEGLPIPICHIKRYKRSTNQLRSSGAVGYCAAKDQKYFGFKGHVLITNAGAVKLFEIAPANVDERDILLELSANFTGDVIADKGLLGVDMTKQLSNLGVNLHAPLRSNMSDKRPKSFVNQLMNIRRKVETVIGQLVERFKIQAIKAKDTWHLLTKIARKVLAHSVCFLINQSANPDEPLKIDLLTA